MEKKSALLVGVGGQGAILTAKVLVNGLMKAGFDVKMSEVHGMSQRGGSVSTQVHWGEKVYSPVIGQGAADIVVAFEKMEAVRYADPMERKDSIDVLEQIFDKVNELSDAVDADDSERIAALCTDIERLVKRRSRKLMDVK